MNTPARIGLGSNRALVATSILEKYDHNYEDPFQKKISCENPVDVAIMDDGFQVIIAPDYFHQ